MIGVMSYKMAKCMRNPIYVYLLLNIKLCNIYMVYSLNILCCAVKFRECYTYYLNATHGRGTTCEGIWGIRYIILSAEGPRVKALE